MDLLFIIKLWLSIFTVLNNTSLMKNLIIPISFIFFLNSFCKIMAQNSVTVLDEIIVADNYKKRSPIYDYSEKKLNNTDTIPGFTSKQNKVKISGIVYESDGVTPAKNVILYICQAGEDGYYELKRYNKKRYVYHRGWIKTNDDGQYNFYTFVPGTVTRSKDLKQIHLVVKESKKTEYDMEAFLFDNDPALTSSCRLKIEKFSNTNRILKLDEKEGICIAKRDIILNKDISI